MAGYAEILGIRPSHKKTLRLLFVAIRRKVGNVDFKSSATKRDWDTCKRMLVWNDEHLKKKLLTSDGKEQWMGEHKKANPIAYSLDVLCQNFCTCKRPVDERAVQRIMDKGLVEPDVNTATHPAMNQDAMQAVTTNGAANGYHQENAFENGNTGVDGNTAIETRSSTAMATHRNGGMTTPRNHHGNHDMNPYSSIEVNAHGNTGGNIYGNGNAMAHGSTDAGSYESAGVNAYGSAGVNVYRNPGVNANGNLGVNAEGTAGVNARVYAAVNAAVNQGHYDAAQGGIQVVAQGNNAAVGPNGGIGIQYGTMPAQYNGNMPNSHGTDIGIPVAGHVPHTNGPIPMAPPYIEAPLQEMMIKKIQDGIFIPYGCPPQFHRCYTLHPQHQNILFHARYADFLARNTTLCYVRVAMHSLLQPMRRLHVVSVPRVPTLAILKAHIRAGLLQTRQVPNCLVGNIVCVLDGDEHQEIADPLIDDAHVALRFRELAWEQQQLGQHGYQYGARLLALLQVELMPIGLGPVPAAQILTVQAHNVAGPVPAAQAIAAHAHNVAGPIPVTQVPTAHAHNVTKPVAYDPAN